MTRPDVAIVDIKMPPTHTDEGLAAARHIRTRAESRLRSVTAVIRWLHSNIAPTAESECL